MRCTWDAQQRVQENNKQRNAAQQATDSQLSTKTREAPEAGKKCNSLRLLPECRNWSRGWPASCS